MGDPWMSQPLRSAGNLLSLRWRLASLRHRALEIRLTSTLERRYDPRQPRVPAGSPNGGRWASGSSEGGGSANRSQEVAPQSERLKVDERAGRISLAARRTLAECKEQYDRDIFHCKVVGLRSCYSQAAVRWIACEKGHPIPPLNY